MAKLFNVVLAFCWAHQRRDFEKLLDQLGHKKWAGGYIAAIRQVYKLNDKRVKHMDTNKAKFTKYDTELRARLSRFKAQLDVELAGFKRQQVDSGVSEDKLMGPRHVVLDCLDRHWQGLTVFVDHPQVPMDNNRTERNFIKLARYRRNCNGAFSELSGEIVASMFTLLYTLDLNAVAVMPYLTAYFEAVAKNDSEPLCGVPLEGFYPWALSVEVQTAINRCARDQPVIDDG